MSKAKHPNLRPAEPDPTVGPPPVRWSALFVLACIVALLVFAGLGVSKAVAQRPSGALAGCKPATEIAPRHFIGPPRMCIDTTKVYLADLITARGKVQIALRADQAPQTVNNFVVLASNGYYNGLALWRVEDWVIQGGDPGNDGRGGPGYTLPVEKAATDAWTTGSVGMARNPDGTVNGSQFFILKSAWPNGGPGTAVFNHVGTVLAGSEFLSQFVPGDRILRVEVSVQK